jgi:hypothetical protein
MPNALLLAVFDFSGAHADEFHDWYDLEHIPERRAIAIPSTYCVARLTGQLPTAIYPCGRSE